VGFRSDNASIADWTARALIQLNARRVFSRPRLWLYLRWDDVARLSLGMRTALTLLSRISSIEIRRRSIFALRLGSEAAG